MCSLDPIFNCFYCTVRHISVHMLWCKLDDEGRTVRPHHHQQCDVSDFDEGRTMPHDGSFNDAITATGRREHHHDRRIRPPSPGATERPLATCCQPDTASTLLYHSPSPLSPTQNSNVHDDRHWTTLSSDDVEADTKDRGDVGSTPRTSASSNAAATDFRPDRLNDIDILERIFPEQRRHTLYVVLAECNGDLLKAIEQFHTFAAAQQHADQHHLQQQQHLQRHRQLELRTLSGDQRRSNIRNGSGDALAVCAAARRDSVDGSLNSMPYAALAKSALASLPPSPARTIHSYFSPRAAAFATEALLGHGRRALAETNTAATALRLQSLNTALTLDRWMQSSLTAAAFPTPAPMSPFVFTHQPHQLPTPAMLSGLWTRLTDHYVHQMTAAAAAAAAAMAGQWTPSHAPATISASLRPTVVLSASTAGAMTDTDHETSRDQALNPQRRRFVSNSALECGKFRE